MVRTVEEVYCKTKEANPMSGVSKILPPHPLTAREDTLARGRGGGGSVVRKTPDTALLLYTCKYFVFRTYLAFGFYFFLNLLLNI
jgi:hypothetical protein